MNNQIILLSAVAAGLLLAVTHAQGDAAAPAAASDPAAAVAPSHLTKGDLTDQEYAFKQHVYELHVNRNIAAGRKRIFDLPPSELAEIPTTHILMRKDAAEHLGKLLAAARADLAQDLASTATDPASVERRARAERVKDIAINNAYRSASHQFRIWDGGFAHSLEATKTQREACVGGEFGEAAADLLRDYIGVRIAAPGFSNHQGGIAVDFSLDLKPAPGAADGHTLGPSMAQNDSWKQSWLWNWLNRRAGEFGFIPYEAEAWHWEYRPDRVGKGRQD